MFNLWIVFIYLLSVCWIWVLILEFNDHFSHDEDFERVIRNKILSEYFLKNSQG